MTHSTHGLILRTRPLTETSLIIHWLTPDWGRLATVARGARRPKSPFAGKLDLFYAADFSFSRSRHSELHTLREASLRETHGAIREDILKLQQAGYAAAFLEQATETETPLPEVFELIRGFLKHLCGPPPQPQNIFALELTPGAKKVVQALLVEDWNATARLKLSGAQVGELGQFLHSFLGLHLGRLPRGRAAALAHLP